MEVLRDYLLRVPINTHSPYASSKVDMPTDEMPDNINGDEHKGSSPAIRQQLLDLWNRLNRR